MQANTLAPQAEASCMATSPLALAADMISTVFPEEIFPWYIRAVYALTADATHATASVCERADGTLTVR